MAKVILPLALESEVADRLGVTVERLNCLRKAGVIPYVLLTRRTIRYERGAVGAALLKLSKWAMKGSRKMVK